MRKTPVSFAFASAMQGWYMAKNRWYEIPIFIVVALFTMQPGYTASWVGIDNKLVMYFLGVLIFALLSLNQFRRRPKAVEAQAA